MKTFELCEYSFGNEASDVRYEMRLATGLIVYKLRSEHQTEYCARFSMFLSQ